jgi:hypothetical protein
MGDPLLSYVTVRLPAAYLKCCGQQNIHCAHYLSMTLA